MHGLWRLVLCIALFALVAHCEEDEADMNVEGVADNVVEHETGHDAYGDAGAGEPEEDDLGMEGDKPLDPEQAKALFTKMDEDKDGKVSMAEILKFSKSTRLEQAEKQIDEHVSMMDEDKDGKVSFRELSPPSNPDGDGEEKTEESKAMQKAFEDLEELKFKQADKNHDGFLDKSELPKAIYPETDADTLAMMAEHTLKHKDKDGDGELNLKEFWQSETNPIEDDNDEAWQDMKEEMVKLDLDGNGKLNLKEIERWESGDHHTASTMKELFDISDVDKDGHIDHPELQKNLDKLHGTDSASLFSEWIEHHEL